MEVKSVETLHVALIGFGTVGKGIYESIEEQREQLESLLDKKVSIDAILIKDGDLEREVDNKLMLTTNVEDLLSLPQLDVVFEAIIGVEPARTYLAKFIEKGCHVVTANKELLAHKGKELRSLATKHKVGLRYEAAVAASIPILSTLREGLKSNQIQEINGILNGTSNFILSELQREGISFKQALNEAKEKGYAEADPTNDIEGWDAFYKILILSDIVYGEQPEWERIIRKGINEVTSADIKKAEALGFRIKHIASLTSTVDGPVISVEPVAVTSSHPFFHITGVNNALQVSGNLAGSITLNGPGAGAYPTASAMIEDLLSLYRNSSEGVFYSRSQENKSEVDDWLLLGDIPEGLMIELLPLSEKDAYYASGKRSDIESYLEQKPFIKLYPIKGPIEKSDISNLALV
ncbi:homoserine dehydrogenase [Bacillus sp. NTK071]|nr:homoserine dehydrogenase [Bacillus sp. NTK071]MBN8209939.1 homoserine dehydrogenase [Bacillus sp. NTK071]